MTIAPLSLRNNYWQDLSITDEDLEFLYNHLLEIETPQTPQELAQTLINERIRSETLNLEQQQAGAGAIYLPKNHYQSGQKVQFPAKEWQVGEVVGVREGRNPEFDPFEVVQVRFDGGELKEFASGLENHKLNQPITINMDDPALNPGHVIKQHGKEIAAKLEGLFLANDDLVKIAGRWFPRSLLVDVNIGFLNLAEAVLEVENGGPLPTHKILEQIELPTDTNPKLTEFSLNLALEEDERFDEVGPSGEVLWFLHRLEPEGVQKPPLQLRYQPVEIDTSPLGEVLARFEALVTDELELTQQPMHDLPELSISLIYPYWRAGVIPLTPQVATLFPTAYESPRVRFTFVDGDTNERFSGWVVRPFGYVYGLRDWFTRNGLIPGSTIKVRRGQKPGEVTVFASRKRPTKEWIRTVLIGADGGVVFAMLKQQIASAYDERMAVALADENAVDMLWQQPKQRISLDTTIFNVMRELTKLNPQGQVHAQDLYAAVNVVRRCPPAMILNALVHHPKAQHLGDLYFRLEESGQGEDAYE
jgi:hypothetical protein